MRTPLVLRYLQNRAYRTGLLLRVAGYRRGATDGTWVLAWMGLADLYCDYVEWIHFVAFFA